MSRRAKPIGSGFTKAYDRGVIGFTRRWPHLSYAHYHLLLVLSMLAGRQRREDGMAETTETWLAMAMGTPRRPTISRWIKELELAGLLEVFRGRDPETGHRTPNLYDLTLWITLLEDAEGWPGWPSEDEFDHVRLGVRGDGERLAQPSHSPPRTPESTRPRTYKYTEYPLAWSTDRPTTVQGGSSSGEADLDLGVDLGVDLDLDLEGQPKSIPKIAPLDVSRRDLERAIQSAKAGLRALQAGKE